MRSTEYALLVASSQRARQRRFIGGELEGATRHPVGYRTVGLVRLWQTEQMRACHVRGRWEWIQDQAREAVVTKTTCRGMISAGCLRLRMKIVGDECAIRCQRRTSEPENAARQALLRQTKMRDNQQAVQPWALRERGGGLDSIREDSGRRTQWGTTVALA